MSNGWMTTQRGIGNKPPHSHRWDATALTNYSKYIHPIRCLTPAPIGVT
jgi:hypothetical protein